MDNYVILPIGDMHVRKEDTEEVSKIIDWIIGIANDFSKESEVHVVFMGDQYNDFAVTRVEVMNFWRKQFNKFNQNKSVKVFALEGNHDMNQDGTASAMRAHDDQINIIKEDVIQIANGVGAIGYIRKEDVFKEKVLEAYSKGIKTILCHTEFQGCMYENGFYAPHGFDLSQYPTDIKFISGHIHKSQEFDKVLYVGTTRHLTRSDIGEVKGITALYSSGNRKFFPTPSSVSEPFTKVVIEEGQEIPDVPPSNRTYVELKGTRDFIKKISKTLPDSVKIKTEYTDEMKVIDIKESDGISKAFSQFSNRFFEENQLQNHKEQILRKIYENCPSLKQGV